MVPSRRRCCRGCWCGTWRQRPSLCGVAIRAMNLHFASQACSEGTGLPLVARLVPGRRCRRGCWCGRRGTWRQAFTTLRGRRGAWRQRPSRQRPSLCVAGMAIVAAAVGVAGVALGARDLHFAWQALHFETWTFTFRGFWRGRRGTWRQRPCVAGMALGDRGLHFTWQAWHFETWTFTLRHLWHWAASHVDAVGRGGRGHWRQRPSLCLVGMVL